MNQGCPASYLVSEDLSWDIPGTTLGKKHIPKHGFFFEGCPKYNFYAQTYPKILRDKLGYPGLSQGPGISRDIPAYPGLYHRCSFPDEAGPAGTKASTGPAGTKASTGPRPGRGNQSQHTVVPA